MDSASAALAAGRFRHRRALRAGERALAAVSVHLPVSVPAAARMARYASGFGPRAAACDARRAIADARAARGRSVGELAEFVRCPSVSAQPCHRRDVARCAQWLAAHLRKIGLEHVEVHCTTGHPIVTADWLRAPFEPTLLIYGHYDVQPADPLEEWDSPPFVPVVRDEYLYGRGASDDKGQMFVHVKALESFLRTSGSLPVNVKCVFDGEEEIGSPSLPGFLFRHASEYRADAALLSDMPILGIDRPAITESLRGVLGVELEVRGPERDLHSGNFGGAILNPLQVLCQLISGMHDSQGRIAIPGFYARLRDLDPAEKAYLARCGPTDSQILAQARARCGWGERGYTLYERTTIRPALSVNGIVGGYQGPGTKAVIPAYAAARLDFRLVPDQQPAAIERLLREFVRRDLPPGMRANVRTLISAHPVVLRRDTAVTGAAAAAYRRAFGVAPVFVRRGGTVPVVHLLQACLGIPVVAMGFALPDDGVHAPNERFHLPTFFSGIETSIHFLCELAGLAPGV